MKRTRPLFWHSFIAAHQENTIASIAASSTTMMIINVTDQNMASAFRRNTNDLSRILRG
jgi:hypothetical protein